MKTIKAVCPRCGNTRELDVKSAKNSVECKHCHKKMSYDFSTLRKMKYVRYFVMLIISCGFAYGMVQFTTDTMSNIFYLLIMVAVAFALMGFVDELVRRITFYLFKMTYMDQDEYEKIMESRKRRRKGKKK